MNFNHRQFISAALILMALSHESARFYFRNNQSMKGGAPIYHPKRKKFKPSMVSHHGKQPRR